MTVERSRRSVDAPVMTFNISLTVAELKREDSWQKDGRNAMTLLKTRGLRIVLVVLQPGAALEKHSTDSPVGIHVVSGLIAVGADAREFQLSADELLTLHPNIEHDVRAIDESAFLLTIASEGAHPGERPSTR